MDIKGKVAIVTGASSGIGLATAQLLTKKGAQVVLVSRSKAKMEKVAPNLAGSFVFVADMAKESDIKKMIMEAKERFGRIDILVNNAGQGYDASIEDINTHTFRQIFELDLIGPLVAMQQVIPQMRKQKSGAIINISSGTALMALPNMAAYSSLKRALVGLSLTAREELKKDNIMVSVIYPYITATDFEKNTIKHGKPDAPDENGGDYQLPEADPAELVASKIVQAIESGEAQIYAHDWMNKPR